MMAEVYQYPIQLDRRVVVSAIQTFLWSGGAATRNAMIGAARAVLDRYNVSHMHLPGMVVRKSGSKYCRIEAEKFVDYIDKVACSGCGAWIYGPAVRILSIREGTKTDLVTYGCKCGGVFGVRYTDMERGERHVED